MINLFPNKNQQDNKDYVFVLFLAGSKAYGLAFNQRQPSLSSKLHQEKIDPFLKNAQEKIEKILEECERELNRDLFLHNTLLVLNSLYTNEKGAIREDFAIPIKKLLSTLELNSLGFVNLSEGVAILFGEQFSEYGFLEESVYDYNLIFFTQGKPENRQKIAKGDSLADTVNQIKEQVSQLPNLVSFYYELPETRILDSEVLIEEHILKKIFLAIFQKKQTEDYPALVEKRSTIPLATNFAPVSLDESKAFVEEPATILSKPHHLPQFSFSFPQKKLLTFLPLGIILLIFIYYLTIYQVEVGILGKSTNLSKNLKLTVAPNKSGIKKFTTSVSFQFTYTTVGEKQTGEKAGGSLIIYNKTASAKVIKAGSKLLSKNNLAFVTKKDVEVPSATTSAAVGEETKTFGKAEVEGEAAAIGAEGNIENNTVLTFSDYSESDFSGLAKGDFSGGFKKTEKVFSSEDQKLLTEKIVAKIATEVKAEFAAKQNADFYFKETAFSGDYQISPKPKLNEEIEEIKVKVTAKNAGIFYISRADLLHKITTQEVDEGEVEKLVISEEKLQKKEGDSYQYALKVKAELRSVEDQLALRKKIIGKTFSTAKKIILEEPSIEEAWLKGKPLPFLFTPLRAAQIKIVDY